MLQLPQDALFNIHSWLIDLRDSPCHSLSEETKLQWRKVCAKQLSYPLETQILIARVAQKYFWTLETLAPKPQFVSRKLDTEWLIFEFLKSPDPSAFKTVDPFVIHALKSMLSRELHPSTGLIDALITSEVYLFEKYAVMFLRKALFESYIRFDQLKQFIHRLLRSKNDSIVIGAVMLIVDFPVVYSSFPEKEFWLISERSEHIQKVFYAGLKFWGDNGIFRRVLEGDSWSIGVKGIMIKHIARHPSVEYSSVLLQLLSRYPNELGMLIIDALHDYQLNGISFSQKQQRQILSFYAEDRGIEVSVIADLVSTLNQTDLETFCLNESTEWSIVIDLLVTLNTDTSKKLLTQYFQSQRNHPAHKQILNAFVITNCKEAEEEIIAQFDLFPEESMKALYYLGGEKTEMYLKEKLGFYLPVSEKVNLYAWEIEAVRFLIETSTNVNDIIRRLKDWNIPYLNQILTRLVPKVDSTFFEAFGEQSFENASIVELKSIIDKIVDFRDPRGLTLLTQLLVHSEEEVRERAFKSLNELAKGLYDDRKLASRQLLFLDKESAVLSCQTAIFLTLLKNKELDYVKKELVLNYLLIEADESQILSELPNLFSTGNLHIEKLVIQLVGKMKTPRRFRFLLPYLSSECDIFRLRQALIAAKECKATFFELKVLEQLDHRNMNIKKAALEYCETSGSLLSVPGLFQSLKTSDNPGLRTSGKNGLKKILKERRFAYLLNELLDSKIKRVQDLLIDCFDSDEVNKVLWIAEQEGNQSLIEFFDSQEQFEVKEVDPIRNNKLDKVLEKLEAVTENESLQEEFLKSLMELNEVEIVLVLSKVRQLLTELDKPSQFLLKVFSENGGVFSEDLAYKGIGVESLTTRNLASIELGLHKGTFREGLSIGLDKTDFQAMLDYFYSSEREEVLAWLKNKEQKITYRKLANQYEVWEYRGLIQDTGDTLDLNPFDLLQSDFFDRDLLASLVFDELSQSQQLDFIFSLGKNELKTLQHQVLPLYRSLDDIERIEFLKSSVQHSGFNGYIHAEKSLLLTKRNKYFKVDELSYSEYEALRAKVFEILELERDGFIKRQDELKKRLNDFSNDKDVLRKLLEKLVFEDVLFKKDWDEFKQLIEATEPKLLWTLICPEIKKGNHALVSLIKSHGPIHKELLLLLDDGALGLKLTILKWLDAYREDAIYFPRLFEHLTKEKEQVEYMTIGIQLMFKLVRYSGVYQEPTFEYVEDQLLNRGESRQCLVLDILSKKAPKSFLSAKNTRVLLRKIDSTDELKTKAISCVLLGVNWNQSRDVQFLLDLFKSSKNTLPQELIDQLMLEIEGIERITQLEVYEQMLEIPSTSEQANEGIVRLFSIDYQVVSLLNEEKINHFFERLKKRLVSIYDEAYLRAIIKSMSLCEIEDYTDQIENLLYEHRSSKIRSLCLRELKKKLEKSAYLKICKGLLEDKDIGILKQAVKTLSFAEEVNIIPRLLPLLENKKTQFRVVAKDAILLLGELALPLLQKEFNKCRPDKREVIAGLMEEIKNESK